MSVEKQPVIESTNPAQDHGPIARLRGRTGAVVAMAITALMYGAFLVTHLAAFNFDPTLFVTPGALYCSAPRLPVKMRMHGLIGYDGQFYYRLALNPLTHKPFDYGIRMDKPAYRQQRILYPALAGALALWRPDWVPWTLILVNYAAICALGFSAGLLALAIGKHPLWGLVIAFYPGLIFSLDRDLTEALAISLVVAALYQNYRRRLPVSGCLLALAVLTRETTVAIAFGLFAEWGWRMLRKKASWSEGAYLGIPLAVFAIWQLWIYRNWGHASFYNSAAMGPPGVAMLGSIKQAVLQGYQKPALLGEMILLFGAVLFSAVALPNSRLNPGLKLAWMFYVVLALLMSENIWLQSDWAYMRAMIELFVLSVLILMSSRMTSRNTFALRFFLPFTFVIWGALAWRVVWRS
jgi:hypothetical protein